MRADDVGAATYPDAARTYLCDGTGLAWCVPAGLRERGRFVVDAEIIAPVRPSLVRRFGVDDPAEFAARWTRAEALAKLADIPIITWLGRHGLGLPEAVTARRDVGDIAWVTRRSDDTTVTFAVAASVENARGSGVVGDGI